MVKRSKLEISSFKLEISAWGSKETITVGDAPHFTLVGARETLKFKLVLKGNKMVAILREPDIEVRF